MLTREQKKVAERWVRQTTERERHQYVDIQGSDAVDTVRRADREDKGAIMIPKELDDDDREWARATRERQWEFMEKVRDSGKLWFTPWNKERLPQQENEWRDGLLTGMHIVAWMESHPDWFIRARWNRNRCAQSIRLTDAGREALQNRHLYDSELVCGGLVGEGWVCEPAEIESS